MRLIDADALMNDIDNDIFNTESRKCYEKMRVRKQPTIDAEPVRHAKAVFKVRRKWDGSAEGITETVPYCSDCGNRIDDLSALWCAGCGAKMDGEDDGIKRKM